MTSLHVICSLGPPIKNPGYAYVVESLNLVKLVYRFAKIFKEKNRKNFLPECPFNRFKAGLFGHHRKLGGGGQALPRCLNAYIFVNTRAKVSKKTSMCQEFYTLFCQSLIFQKNFTIIEKLLVFVTPLKISLFSEKREKRNKSGYASTGCG